MPSHGKRLQLAAASSNGTIPIGNLVSGQLGSLLPDDWAVHSVIWTPYGRLVSVSIPKPTGNGGRELGRGTP